MGKAKTIKEKLGITSRDPKTTCNDRISKEKSLVRKTVAIKQSKIGQKKKCMDNKFLKELKKPGVSESVSFRCLTGGHLKSVRILTDI